MFRGFLLLLSDVMPMPESAPPRGANSCLWESAIPEGLRKLASIRPTHGRIDASCRADSRFKIQKEEVRNHADQPQRNRKTVTSEVRERAREVHHANQSQRNHWHKGVRYPFDLPPGATRGTFQEARMRFPARRNLGPGIVKSPSAARNRAGIFLTKLGSSVALEGGRLRDTGPSPAASAGNCR
jgi:hypothetical protein